MVSNIQFLHSWQICFI